MGEYFGVWKGFLEFVKLYRVGGYLFFLNIKFDAGCRSFFVSLGGFWEGGVVLRFCTSFRLFFVEVIIRCFVLVFIEFEVGFS